ncbi:hypothetical protein [Qipengyuania nanhaisediminis]|uniref:hypothetical protein n=1 Tax=Qipengyuania nanhaisediminis TaxID=604088 RepID=UPI0038B413AB
MRALLVAAVLCLSAPLAAHELPNWRAVDAETGQIRDVERLEALAADFPDSGSVRLRLLNAQLGEGDVEAVLASLAWLQERGYIFSEAAQAQIPELIGEEHAESARALLIRQPDVIEASEAIALVPAGAGLVETVLAYDEALVVTSVTRNSLWVLAPSCDWLSVPIAGVSDLSGIVRVPGDSEGWAASSNLDGSDDAPGLFNGLLYLSDDLENPARIPAPEGVALSDLSIAADGTVYASDPLGGGIYRKPAGIDALESLVAPGTFRSPQGSAVSADGTRLYVSDYRYGLAMIDIEYGTVSRVASDVPVLLDGVDGLWRHGHELIAIQNGTSPMRISAFTLSGDGTRIVAARVLEQAHGEWTEPLGGSLSGEHLVYVGTGQWDRYDKGALKDGMQAIPTQIRRLPLGSGDN